MSATSFVLAVAVAAILGVAGCAKLFDRSAGLHYKALAVAELLVAGGLMIDSWRSVALGIASVLGACFVTNALLTQDATCLCFGRRFATANRSRKLVRASSVFVFSAAGLVLALASHDQTLLHRWRITEVVLGLTVGSTAVLFPLLWVRPETASWGGRDV